MTLDEVKRLPLVSLDTPVGTTLAICNGDCDYWAHYRGPWTLVNIKEVAYGKYIVHATCNSGLFNGVGQDNIKKWRIVKPLSLEEQINAIQL